MANEIRFNSTPPGPNGFVEFGDDEETMNMNNKPQRNIDSQFSRVTPSDVSSFAERANEKIAGWGKAWHDFKNESPNLQGGGEISANTLETVGRGGLQLIGKGLNMATGALDVVEGFYLDREFGSGSGVGKPFAVALGKSMVGIGGGLGAAFIFAGSVSLPVIAAGLGLSAVIKFGLDAATAKLSRP